VNPTPSGTVMPGMRKAGAVLCLLVAACVLVTTPAHASPVRLVAAGCDPVGVTPYDPPRLSGGGSVVAFATTAQLVPSDTNGTLDVYIQGVRGGRPDLVSVRRHGSPGHGRSGSPSIMQELRLVGFDVQLVTAPFVGLAGGIPATAEHCATVPMDETAQNEGCVRVFPGP
jgi:hypothetical protein